MKPLSASCRRPYLNGNLAHGCGQCMPCRIRDRRIWVHRNLLENRLHGDSSFLTCTYDEEHHAQLGPPFSLDFSHHTLFLKKLRRRFTTSTIRFFGCGEYGERSGRPHFHYILYGFPTCSGTRCYDRRYSCEACKIARAAWGKGNIYLGDVTKDSISYVAGYITKGWTTENDWNREFLKGRTPEGSRMSGGLGGKAIDKIADSFLADPNFHESFLGETGDVPNVLLTDKKVQPLGRYLKSRFRKRLGWENTNLPEEKLDEWKKEMRALYAENFEGSGFTPQDSNKKSLLIQLSKTANDVIENKFRLFNLRGAL